MHESGTRCGTGRGAGFAGSGQRDLDIPATLLRTLGHADCGVYAEVVADGEIADGDTVRAIGD